jgi:glycine cleavage system H lipoate-binding protein
MNEQQNNYKLIPEGDFRCVWMSAGILSYQLCNRSFDCDGCPLDAAMRQHFPRPQPDPGVADQSLPSENEELEPRAHYRYTPTHFWVKSISDSLVRVGIEPGLSRALLIPRTIVLPSAGETVKASEPCLWFVLDEKTIPFCSFADGVVAAQNSLLSERPYKVYYHPYDQGWLFDMTVDKTSPPPSFLTTSAARTLYKQDQKLFREKLGDAIQNTSAGITLPDGGQMLQDVSAMLGPKRYFDLVWEVFLKKKSR